MCDYSATSNFTLWNAPTWCCVLCIMCACVEHLVIQIIYCWSDQVLVQTTHQLAGPQPQGAYFIWLHSSNIWYVSFSTQTSQRWLIGWQYPASSSWYLHCLNNIASHNTYQTSSIVMTVYAPTPSCSFVQHHICVCCPLLFSVVAFCVLISSNILCLK